MLDNTNPLLNTLIQILDDIQAIEVVVMDVRKITTVTDYMIVCSGRSSRHVKAITEYVIEHMEQAGLPPISHSGLESADWALVDLGDFVVHVMQPDARATYNLEGLWQEQVG